jgi:uncharacterized MAPEG superfamily protein
VVLGLIQIVLAAGRGRRERNLAWLMGPRDDWRPVDRGSSPMRLARALANFPGDLPAVRRRGAGGPAGRQGGNLSYWGSILYLGGRALYLPLYALGTPVLRTVVWTVSMVGILNGHRGLLHLRECESCATADAWRRPLKFLPKSRAAIGLSASALKAWGDASRFAGAKDRAFVSGLVLDVLRKRRSLGWRMRDETPARAALGALRFLWDWPLSGWRKLPARSPWTGPLTDAELGRAGEPPRPGRTRRPRCRATIPTGWRPA